MRISLALTQRFSLAVLLCMALVGAGLWPADGSAQVLAVREFPAAAKRGMLVVTAPPQVMINGSAEQLAPGVRIRGPNNMLVMSASLVGKSVLVNYVREKQGAIQEVWILTQAEADLERSGMEPITNFIFGSSVDKPKTDDGKTPFDQLPKFPKQ